MITFKLKAEERKLTGRKVKKLRAQGFIPSNIFGKGVKSRSVQVREDEFRKVFSEAGETGLIELGIGDLKPVYTLVSGVQKHPVNDVLLHIDFKQVDLTKKVKAMVPVEIVGESPAEKNGIGTVVQQVKELEVEALPADLPEKFEVDASVLEKVDQAIYLKDLSFDKSKITLEEEEDKILVKVEPPQKVEEAPKTQGPVGGEVAEPQESKGSNQPEELEKGETAQNSSSEEIEK